MQWKFSAFCFFLCLPFYTTAQLADSLEIKIGQMLMMGLPNNPLDTGSAFYKDVKAGKIGGITMYERHLTPTNAQENLRALISFYQVLWRFGYYPA
jgi:hypothetical protein